jgi:phosphoribosyl-AMP cyclohydrolase / phosphoribosyl-ATP pyrophosphohydrolase
MNQEGKKTMKAEEMQLKFDKDGLIPAVAQDAGTGEVLMMAYMNIEALQKTLDTGYMTYWSRSRNTLWQKGETSGHVQKVKSLKADCDADCLLALVEQEGPACHTGNRTCFFTDLKQEQETTAGPWVLEELFGVISDRKKNPNESSYTSKLFSQGMERIAKKVGEESAEVIIAAMKGNTDEIRYESADLLYHLLVLLAASGMAPEEVYRELLKRRK